MTRIKQETLCRKKRKRTFGGVKKQDLPIQSTAGNDTDTIAESSPVKKSCSFENINRNCPLIESKMSKVHTRKMKIELGLEMSSPNNIVRCHSNKIIDSTLLQECISEAAICSKCKSSKSRLELWQDDTKRCGLDEWLFPKCSEYCHILRLQSSKKCENRFSEINIRSVNAGIISGNGISNMQKIMSHLNLPRLVTSTGYNNILKKNISE